MAEKKMQLEDWLDDLCVRFIINLPQEDLSTVARICFHVEEAQWFYEDFIRPLDPTLPSMSLRSFCLRIFQHCPLLSSFSVENHMRAFEEFLQYKTRVPVRGAILLNQEMDHTVLVKGWKKGANWSFPRGKINKDEDDLDCAIREVYEETGFDIAKAGLVPKPEDVKYIQISMREQQIRLYVFRDIPMDTPFQPMTRKEISKIQWYKLSELPAFRKKGNHQTDGAAAASNANKFYMVAPFLVPLKKWVVQQKKKDARFASHSYRGNLEAVLPEEPVTEDDIGNHTEPAHDQPTSTPAIETLEGATRELQRLLKIQPQSAIPAAPAAQDKGASLMAILQRKGQGFPQQQQQQQPYQQAVPPPSQLPHTPLDLMYSSAPQPNTPHYHHPTQRLPANYSQPPPNFPIPTHLNAQVSQSQLNAHQQHHDLPAAFYSQTQLLQQLGVQNVGYPGYNPNSRIYPGNQQSRQPVLLHPQPLPPQVQQSLLVRGILPTPNLEAMANPGGHGHSNLKAQVDSRQAPAAPRQQGLKMVSSQLSGHKLSLLNVFKTDPTGPAAPAGQGPQNASVPGHAHSNQGSPAQIPPSQGPTAPGPPAGFSYPTAPWANPPNAPTSAQSSQASPAHLVSGTQLTPNSNAHSAASMPPKPAQPTDKHRSALLDMFKKQGPLSPASSEATVRPNQAQPIASISGLENTQPTPLSSAEAILAATKANGGPVRMNPEANLPFRALEILSRPKQSESSVPQNSSIPQHNSPAIVSPNHQVKSPGHNAGVQSKSSPQGQSVVLRGENEAKHSPLAQSAGLPYGNTAQPPQQSPLGSTTIHSGPTPTRRQDANPEQKQKLLSLFGKPQTSPTGPTVEEKGKEPAMYDQVQPGVPRSRVTSVTGGNDINGINMSRQNSQTPISPADRSFLLDYLQQVSNSSR